MPTVWNSAPSWVTSDVWATTGDWNTAQIAGRLSAIVSSHHPTSERRRSGVSNGNHPRTTMATIGITTAGWMIDARAVSATAGHTRLRRHMPIAKVNAAIDHKNGSWPSSGEITSDGLVSVAAAHHPRRSVGKVQNVAAMVAAKPSTSQSVTARSPSSGHTSAALAQGTDAYGNVSP